MLLNPLDWTRRHHDHAKTEKILYSSVFDRKSFPASKNRRRANPTAVFPRIHADHITTLFAVVQNEPQTNPSLFRWNFRNRRIAWVRWNAGDRLWEYQVLSWSKGYHSYDTKLRIIAWIESVDYSSCVCDNAPEDTRCLTDDLTVALWCELVRNDEQERTEDFFGKKKILDPLLWFHLFEDCNFLSPSKISFP